MSWFGWIFMTVWWVLVILAVVWLARTAAWSAGRRQIGEDRSRRILDERFASGELSVEEYEERRRVLERKA